MSLSDERAFFHDAQPWGFILFARHAEDPDQLSALTAALRDAVGRDAAGLPERDVLVVYGSDERREVCVKWECARVCRVAPCNVERYLVLGGA